MSHFPNRDQIAARSGLSGGNCSERSVIRRRYRRPAVHFLTKGSGTTSSVEQLTAHVDLHARRRAATSGGTNASAMPCPSIGEKLPLVTTPIVGAVAQHPRTLAWRAAALDAEPAQPARDPPLALGRERRPGPGSRPCPSRRPNPARPAAA